MRYVLTAVMFLLFAQSLLAATIGDVNSMIYGASISRDGDNLLFKLLFASNPDFNTVDNFGRPADSFQWYLTSDAKAIRPLAVADMIIRGDEMRLTGEVTVCTTKPLGSGCPGGWGLDLGEIQPTMDRFYTMSFEAPNRMFGSDIAYDVTSFRYGAQVDGFYGTVDGGAAKQWAPICPIYAPRCYDFIDPPKLILDPIIQASSTDPISASETSTALLLLIGISGVAIKARRT